jgi:pimeloyl-ACP methyl ester carboxylesterase
MAMFYSLLIVLVAVAVLVSSLKEIPAHARGGIAYQNQKGKLYSSNLKASSALTWNAKVDNFDAASNSTFAQRYYVDNQYWDGSGPVFFEIGGEGTLSGAPGGYIGSLAQEYSALVVALEHRFYGESIPNGNVNTDNLKYLAVDQALADLSSFTTYFKESYGTKNAPWFVFGGSYPGALSSWYRAAYPDQSVGSLSSSGVVNCIVDYYQFDMQVAAAIGNECADQIKRINGAFERATTTPQGFQNALSQFHCESDMWKEDFFYMMADSWSMADQYSAKSQLCSAVLKPGADASDEVLMQTFADFSNSFWGADFCAGGFCKYLLSFSISFIVTLTRR